MFNCFYSLSRFCSDVCDLLICTFDAYFIKLFRISYNVVVQFDAASLYLGLLEGLPQLLEFTPVLLE